MSRKLEDIRNIGVVAHIDAGKTTVTERMLYYSGAKHRVGMVDKGTAETDSDPEEQERGITIYSACVTFPWKNVSINLLDTPGHVDFTAEVERCLRVLDGCVVVFSAREGVEAQSETVWRQADKYDVSRIVFINKMDREGADFERTLEDIEKRLSAQPFVVQIPAGSGPAHMKDPFRGVIDLVHQKLLTFEPEKDGKNVIENEIPEELQPEVDLWREKLIDGLSNFNDELMEKLLEEEPVPSALIEKVIREATLAQQIQPVFCGTALHGIGVQPVLDGVAKYLPSPADMPAVKGVDLKDAEKILKREPVAKEPFCGLVFKIIPAKTGDLYFIRIYSGELKANSRVLNASNGKKENIAQLWQIHATKKDKEGQIDLAGTGDIVGVIGPRDSVTGDTLCETKSPIILESIDFPETVISMAIEPESTAERKKLGETLEMMKRQDPTFRASENEDTGQTLISGMGELHLEVIKHRLLRDFNLNVKVHKPRVNYRETVANAVEVIGECNRQIENEQLYARLTVKIEPSEHESGPAVIVTSRVPPDTLEGDFLMAALDELQGCSEGGGVVGGFPLSKLRITIMTGEAHLVNSNDVAFRIAASDAFEKALRKAGPILLEPIMKLDINTPEENMGDIVGDIQQRRGIVAQCEPKGEIVSIEAHVPLAELFGYSSAIRSLSQGRAGCSMEPLEFAPAPPEVADGFAF
jgi:elongation factor G